MTLCCCQRQKRYRDERRSKYLGFVRGNTIRARHVGRDILARLRNLVGGEIVEYTKLLAESREQALDRMIEEAQKLGANAIVAAAVLDFRGSDPCRRDPRLRYGGRRRVGIHSLLRRNTVRTTILLTAVLCSVLIAFSTSAGSGPAKTPSVEGTWLGTLKVSTIELRLVFHSAPSPTVRSRAPSTAPTRAPAEFP